MKQNLLNKLWLRVGMIVAIMTTALSGTAKADTAAGTFEINFYDSSKLSSTSGTGLTNSNYSSFVAVPTGVTSTDVVTSVSVTGTVQYGKNGGLTAGTGTAASANSHYVTFSIGSGYAVTKCTVYATAYESGRWLLNDNAADQGSLGSKGATIDQVTTPLVWDNLGGVTALTFKKDNGSGGNQKRLTIYKIVCEYSTGGSSSTPSLSVNPTSIAFGEKTINGSYQETFDVTFANLTENLTVSGFTGVTVSPTTISKTATSPQTVTVTYAPTTEGSINGIIIVGNTEDNLSQTVAVTGSAYDPANVPAYNLFTGTLVEGDYIICYNGFAMKNTVSSSRLGYAEVTATNDVISTNDASIVWHIAKSGEYWTIYNAGVGKYAASTGSKNQGTLADAVSDNAKWTVTGSSTYDFENLARSGGSDPGNKWLRYNAGYGFACYASGTGGALSLYKLDDGTPSISATDPAELAYDATGGEITYSITNPTSATLSAASNSAWITNVAVDATNSKVTFNTSTNPNTTQRTGSITLSYTGADDKVVTITQAAAPVIYTTIPAIFDAATSAGSTATNVNVTFGNWVVSGVHGSNAFVTDNNGNGFIIYKSSHGFAVNNKLSGTVMETPLKLYNGSAEFTNLTNSTEGLTVSNDGAITVITNKTIADLGGVNTGAVITLSNLTYDGTNLSDGTNTIKPYNTLYSDMSFTSGKTYNVTGVYQQYGSTKEILPRSAEDIEEVVVTTPSIFVADATVNVGAAGVDDGEISVTYNNIATVTAEIVFYTTFEATTVTTEPTWIVTDINSSNNVEYIVEENTSSEARTVYMKVKVGDVYSNLVTITQAAPAAPVTYVALVAEYNGTYFAVNKSFASKTFSATAVDNVVNGKVVNGETDDISWAITESNGKATIVNKDGSTYIGFSGSDLNTNSAEWTIDNDNHSWKTSTNRYFYYRESANGFRSYSYQNINAEGYSGYTTAYTFADGYTRDVTASNYGTICLPYDVAAEDFSGVKFYKIASKKMSGETLVSVNLEEVTSLSAGCAYIFQANDDATKLVAAYSGEEAATPVAANASVTGLVGTYSRTAIPQGCYVLKDGQIWYVDQANYMFSGANKAYIDLTNVLAGSAGVKQIVLFCGDDDATGISMMEDGRSLMEDGAIYNVAGQRISKMQKGINIVNGKKIAVK